MSVMADRAMGLLEHLLIDPESDALLDGLVRGLLDPAERLSLAAHGDGDQVGPWQMLTDPGVAPLWALPYAAQWTGGIPPARLAGESDDDYLARARTDVIQPRAMRRGSTVALQAAARPHLTGTQLVRIAERLDGDIWEVGVLILESETPDIAAVEQAVNDPDVITAGMHATVDYLTAGATWTIAELEDIYASRTLADLEGDFVTLSDLETHALT